MKSFKLKTTALLGFAMAIAGCGDEIIGEPSNPGVGPTPPPSVELAPQPQAANAPKSANGDVLLGNPEYKAVSYGAWRTNARIDGATVPSVEQQKEDMKILSALGIKVIRTYNTQGYTGLDGKTEAQNLLQAISELKQDDPSFEMYVILGIWIDALNSWSDKTPDATQNNPVNYDEVAAAKELALAYPDIIKVIAVGNEAMVEWAPYHVTPKVILEHVNDLQSWKKNADTTKDIWITTSENHAVWAGLDGNGNYEEQAYLKQLIKAVDYVSLHTYAHHDTLHSPTFKEEWKIPVSQQHLSKEEQIDYSMDIVHDYTVSQIQVAQAFINNIDPTKQIHIGETGWSTISTDGYGAGGTQAADEYKQKIFHDNMRDFSNDFGASLFYFQAFDEPWKGDTSNVNHSEQHFGLIDINCNVKHLEWNSVTKLNKLGLTRDCPTGAFTASFGGDLPTLMESVLTPPHVAEVAPPPEGTFEVLGDTLFDGAQAFGWETPITAWAGVDNATGILTVATLPDGAKEWGWGIGVANPSQNIDLTGYTKLTFKVRGVVSDESVMAEFPFFVGFQSTAGNHWIKFNTGDYTLNGSWQTVTVNVNNFSGKPTMNDVNTPFSVSSIDEVWDPSKLTKSNIEFKEIAWLK
ncbi:hypothetical protein HGP28_17680 [Vibrio sp. SM6]|uniref:Endo-1,3-beta-glucanase btgC n=1 Tax=Vibrio agarilyticus TaxID=2726741 RepID=A0A7X8YIS0_9VIBR|nr:hypothetical protein [Vibrio agarilyticus]NLS14692.1 hypothetical protein [Vibrio agarilyticus]